MTGSPADIVGFTSNTRNNVNNMRFPIFIKFDLSESKLVFNFLVVKIILNRDILCSYIVPGVGADTQILVWHLSRLVREIFLTNNKCKKPKNTLLSENSPSKFLKWKNNLTACFESWKSGIFESSRIRFKNGINSKNSKILRLCNHFWYLSILVGNTHKVKLITLRR